MEGKLAEVTVGSTDIAPQLDQARPTLLTTKDIPGGRVRRLLICPFGERIPGSWHPIELRKDANSGQNWGPAILRRLIS